MPCARVLPRLAAALLAAALAAGACAPRAPLEERVQKRLAARDFDGALALLDERLAKAPADDAAKALRVRVLLQAARTDKAVAGYAALSEATIEGDPRMARQLALTLVSDAFRKSDAYLQARGAMALAAMGDQDALPLFREALAHENPSVRAQALRGLGRVKGPEAAALAEKALEDRDEGVRAVAAEALGAMGAEGAKSALWKAYQDQVPMVRLRAAVALALLGDPEAQAILRRAIAAPDEAPGTKAGDAANTPGPADGWAMFVNRPAERDYLQVVVAEVVARLGDPQGRAALVRLLDHRLTFVALFAAESLSNLGDQAPRAFLRKVLEDPSDGEHRLYAAWTLARLGDDAGVPAVLDLLARGDEHVRQQAAWTMGQMGRLAPLAPLRRALTDQNLGVRYQAAWALGEILAAAPTPPQPAKTG
jgi:HEAT repeat protein